MSAVDGKAISLCESRWWMGGNGYGVRVGIGRRHWVRERGSQDVGDTREDVSAVPDRASGRVP